MKCIHEENPDRNLGFDPHALCRIADALEPLKEDHHRIADALSDINSSEWGNPQLTALCRIADALEAKTPEGAQHQIEVLQAQIRNLAARDGTHWLCECSAFNRVEDESCTACNVSRIYPRPDRATPATLPDYDPTESIKRMAEFHAQREREGL